MKQFDFGEALKRLKAGRKVARMGWNGKGMFLYYVGWDKYPAKTDIAKTFADRDSKVTYHSYIAIKTTQGYVIPWLASQADMLDEDWVEVE